MGLQTNAEQALTLTSVVIAFSLMRLQVSVVWRCRYRRRGAQRRGSVCSCRPPQLLGCSRKKRRERAECHRHSNRRRSNCSSSFRSSSDAACSPCPNTQTDRLKEEERERGQHSRKQVSSWTGEEPLRACATKSAHLHRR